MNPKTKDILKAERIKRGMTQEEVANYLHIGRVAYTMYETGKNTPTMDNLILLADLYNCSLDYLAGRYSLTEIAKEQFQQGYEIGQKAGDEIIKEKTKKPRKRKTV